MAFAGYMEASTGYPVTSNPVSYPTANPVNTITKFNEDGTLGYSFLYAQAEDVQPLKAIAMDEEDNLYIAIVDHEDFMPTTANAFQENNRGNTEIHLASFDSLGNWNWASFLGGAASEEVEFLEYKDGQWVATDWNKKCFTQ